MKQISRKLLTLACSSMMIVLIASCTMAWDSDPSAPAQPTVEIVGDSVNSLMVKVSWQAVSGAGGYHVYRAQSGDYEFVGSTGPEQTSFLDADEDLTLGAYYTYKVQTSSLWHDPASASPLSSASSAIQFFLAPSWETIPLSISGVDVARIRIAPLQAGAAAYAYADTDGYIHTGLIYPEDDPDSDEAADIIMTHYVNDESGYVPQTSSSDPIFEIVGSGSEIILAYTDVTDTVRVHTITPERTDEDGSAVSYTWTHTNRGTNLPAINDPASLGLAVTQGGFGNTAQYLYVSALLTLDDPQETKLYRMDLSTNSAWGDLSPSPIDDFSTADADFAMIGNEPTLAITDPDVGGTVKLFTMLDPQAGGDWSSAYPGLPVITPAYGMISLITNTALTSALPIVVTVSEAASDPVWDIQRYDSDSWVDITTHIGFSDLFADAVTPFSTASTLGELLVFTSTDGGGGEMMMYDTGEERWFTYGNPGCIGLPISPAVIVSGGRYIAAWIEPSTLDVVITFGE